MKLAFPMMIATALLLSACSEGGTPSEQTAVPYADAAPVTDTTTAAEVIDGLFQSSDLNGNGFLSPSEAAAFMNLSLVSQDADEDGRLSLEEFQAWDAGFLAVATANGVVENYTAQKAALFNAWDSDRDGYLVFAEFEDGIRRDFGAVPKAEEGHVTPGEFADVAFVKNLAAAAEPARS